MEREPRHRSPHRLTRPPLKNDLMASGALWIDCALFSIMFLVVGVYLLAHGHAIGIPLLGLGVLFPVYLLRHFRLPPLPRRK